MGIQAQLRGNGACGEMQAPEWAGWGLISRWAPEVRVEQGGTLAKGRPRLGGGGLSGSKPEGGSLVVRGWGTQTGVKTWGRAPV